jgi:dimethylamine monooxygenase subunit C
MLVSGIKSRPVYKGLSADAMARRNIICAEAEGALTVLEMASSAPDGFMAKCEILYTARSAAGQGLEQQLAALKPDVQTNLPTIATLLVRLDGHLSNAAMGTRLYVTGTEGFIGACMQLAMRHGVDQASIRTAHRGSEMRRMQCVHCKGVTEEVTTNPAKCTHCGLMLLVRDHYSRRIGAFQGVCVDAEEPGSVPPIEEAFR